MVRTSMFHFILMDRIHGQGHHTLSINQRKACSSLVEMDLVAMQTGHIQYLRKDRKYDRTWRCALHFRRGIRLRAPGTNGSQQAVNRPISATALSFSMSHHEAASMVRVSAEPKQADQATDLIGTCEILELHRGLRTTPILVRVEPERQCAESALDLSNCGLLRQSKHLVMVHGLACVRHQTCCSALSASGSRRASAPTLRRG
jgi:hypothetical protein